MSMLHKMGDDVMYLRACTKSSYIKITTKYIELGTRCSYFYLKKSGVNEQILNRFLKL